MDFSKFTKKVGPLPAYGWGAILVAIGVVIYLWRKKNSAHGTTTTESALSQGDAASYDYSSTPTGDESVGLGGGSGGTSVMPANAAPTNNLAWESQATNYLLGFGYPADAITQALNNFLYGLQASAADRGLYNLAVAKWGLPPEGVPPQPTQVTPTQPITTNPVLTAPDKANVPPPPNPVTHTYYTVASGDTLYGIARKVGVSETTLYSQNQATIEAAARAHGKTSSENGHWIYPGSRLMIK